mmetsp:Transcript_15041/g.63292  ORF Transcript_15041/g.63292 Transcript_15041/m.63292 type:complete len:365 (-) Transcript_15041:3661-4755(-)
MSASAQAKTAAAAAEGESWHAFITVTSERSHRPSPPLAWEDTTPHTSRWHSSAAWGGARSWASHSAAVPFLAAASAMSIRSRSGRSCLATNLAPSRACLEMRSSRSPVLTGSTPSNASSFSPATAAETTWRWPTADAAVAPDALAAACSSSHTTRQYTAASGDISSASDARRRPPPAATPSGTDCAASLSLTRPHSIRARTADAATSSLDSASRAATSARTSPSKASSHRLSMSMAAPRTASERSVRPRRTAAARRAMETDATGTLEVRARKATRRTSSDASLVLSTTWGMVKSEMAREPRMDLRTSLFFSAPSRVMNEVVMTSSLKLPSSPLSWSRLSALAACARTTGTLSRRRSSITSSMRS